MLNPYLERQRLIIVFATIVLNVIAVALFARFPSSDWKTGFALAAVDNLLLFIHVLRMRDLLMLRLMLFGLIAGLVELLADTWLVQATGTLDYSIAGSPMLWHSPFWMPFAWEILAVQFGYIGLRLLEAMGWQGLAVSGLLGAIIIPYYEEMALHARWWQYSHCRMISHVPYYVIIGEFLIVMSFGRLATCVRQRDWGQVVFGGGLGGIAILASYALSYLLTDRVWQAI